MTHAVLKTLINDHPKTIYPFTKSIIYFTDGSSIQYKNYENFTNLLMHGKYFGMEAKYHFFATSHDKNLCDGVEGAINRFAAHASLLREVQNQVLNPYQIYNFVKSDIHNVTCFFVDKHQVEVISKFLSSRFEKTKNFKRNWRLYFNVQNFRGRCCSNRFD